VLMFNQSLEFYTYQAAEANSDFNFYYLGNLYENMESLATSDEYADTLGLPCNDDTVIYNDNIIPQGFATGCYLNNDPTEAPYLFWNTSHLASPGQQVIAKSVLDWLVQGETVLDTGQVTQPTREEANIAALELLFFLIENAE
jgi:hypothetical protein